jgi:hypothetical protein
MEATAGGGIASAYLNVNQVDAAGVHHTRLQIRNSGFIINPNAEDWDTIIQTDGSATAFVMDGGLNTATFNVALTATAGLTVVGAVSVSGVSNLNGGVVISSALPILTLNETDGAVDNRAWNFGANGEQLYIQAVNAALGTQDAIRIDRTAEAIDRIQLLTAGTVRVDINGATTTISELAVTGTVSSGTWNGTIIGVGYGGTGLAGGTSGGILYFFGTATIASSALLTENAIVRGGGAGVAPSTSTNLTFDGSTLALAGAQTISSTLTTSGAHNPTSNVQIHRSTGGVGNCNVLFEYSDTVPQVSYRSGVTALLNWFWASTGTTHGLGITTDTHSWGVYAGLNALISITRNSGTAGAVDITNASLNFTPANLSAILSPTGTGTVTINPAARAHAGQARSRRLVRTRQRRLLGPPRFPGPSRPPIP